jgi:glycosyltransferase involved in cell wall biosynthesis
MRIVVADYSGHPFQAQLAREMARRGHEVLHLHFAEFQTPKGRLSTGPDDPATLTMEAIFLGKPFAKHSFIKRRFQEIAVGKKFASRISALDPDIVIASNLPLDSLSIVAKRSQADKRAFVFWQQDIYSIAIEHILTAKFGLLGSALGKFYKAVERHVLINSDGIVAISTDFLPCLRDEFGVKTNRVHVIENWAPLTEITPRPKDNPWSREHGLVDKDVVLYTGTLGMKHDPRQLLTVAKTLCRRPNAVVVVASEGPAVDWLRQQARELQLHSLRLVGFQPFETYPDVLGSADVLISILEPDAGVFSVPSKVLSYLCAGRPIVLSAPAENLAARIIEGSQAGIVVTNGNSELLASAIERFLGDVELKKSAGIHGRRYAEKKFDIRAIGDSFEGVIAESRQIAAARARDVQRSLRR